MLTLRGIITLIVLIVLFALAVVWISKNGGWKGEGCGGNCASCHSRCEKQDPNKKPEFKNAPGHCLLAASRGILLSAFRLAVKHPALCRVHGNGAQQVLMGFLVSSAADVQLIDHIVLRAVLHIAQLDRSARSGSFCR